jgi:predicted small lipoprotein YifL
MRLALAFLALTGVSACGQTGSLYLPDEGVETPVEIRAPGQAAEDEEEEKPTQPPGR